MLSDTHIFQKIFLTKAENLLKHTYKTPIWVEANTVKVIYTSPFSLEAIM